MTWGSEHGRWSLVPGTLNRIPGWQKEPVNLPKSITSKENLSFSRSTDVK
jgi:hypothetical protein